MGNARAALRFVCFVLCALTVLVPAAQAQTATIAWNWTQKLPASRPGARYLASMAYDASTRTLVLFGGIDTYGNRLNDTWMWDGTNWTQLSPVNSPGARGSAAMSYDASSGTVVLFGGSNSSNLLSDTWTWDGTNWTQQSPSNSPGERADASMAYSPSTGMVVLFGGTGPSNVMNDTWTWDGTNWTQLNPATMPSARAFATAAYDASTSSVLLFGGEDSSGNDLNDTWTWDGTNWTQQSPAASPSPRVASSMAYDATTGIMALFGGTDDSGNDLNDTWTWDGMNWTQQSPAASPSARGYASMAYDAGEGAVLLFGGDGNLDDTWTFQAGPINFGNVNVGSHSSTATVTFQFTSGGTIGTPAVLTLGTPNLDFADAGTGSCTTNGTSYSYNTGEICTVNVTFSPMHAGERSGAIELLNSSGGVIATGYVYGIGVGPQIAFLPPAQSTLGGGFNQPHAVAVDGSGNVYIADTNNGALKEMPANCLSSSCVTTLITGPAFGDVAVDGNGNIYLVDQGSDAVEEMPAGCTSSSCVMTLGGSFLNPQAVAVDGPGNVYVADRDRAVKEMPAGCSSSSCVSVLGGGFSTPFGVALDGLGNVYVADLAAKAVKEMPPGCTSSGCVTTLGGGFSAPYRVAVDAAGNVYVLDARNVVKQMPAGCSSSTCVTTLGNAFGSFGLAVDGSGNIYVVDNNAVKELNVSTSPNLNFPTSTTAGSADTTDNPQTFTVENIGNATLNFESLASLTSLTTTPSFSLDSSTTCPVANGTPGSLGVGASCTIGVDFTPQSGGSITGSVALTDNSLNAAAPSYATQNAGLSGTGSIAAPSITNAFGAANMPLHGTTTLAFSISNSNQNGSLTGIAFTDSLPSGLAIATPSSLYNSCSGTPTAVAGSTSVTLSGASVAAGANCTVQVNVTGTTSGVKNNSVQVSSTNGGTGNISTAMITVISPPILTKAFGAASIPLTGSTSLSFTVQNPNTSSPLTGLGFNDTLPSGLILSTPNGLFGNCGGGTITATQGSNTVSLNGGTLAASNSCTFSVNVTSITAGEKNNTTSSVTSNEGGSGTTASASIAVIAPPSITAAFNPGTIGVGASTSLTFTITNPTVNNVAETGVVFADTLPTGLTVANGTASSVCGGALMTTSPGTILLTGASIGVGGQCQFSVTVTGTAPGQYTNTTGAVSSTDGGTGNTATANLSVAGITLSASSIDFGTIYLGRAAMKSITLSNAGTTPVTVSSLRVTTPGNALGDYSAMASCGPLGPKLPGTLPAGKSCTIYVGFMASAAIFSPTASTATLAVNDNAPGSPQTVSLTAGVVNPRASMSANALSFSNQKVDTTSGPESITIRNTGNTTLILGTISVSGDFAIASGTTCENGGTIDVSKSCQVILTFTPTVKGSRTGTLTIPDNALNSPQRVALSGRGD